MLGATMEAVAWRTGIAERRNIGPWAMTVCFGGWLLARIFVGERASGVIEADDGVRRASGSLHIDLDGLAAGHASVLLTRIGTSSLGLRVDVVWRWS